MRSFMQIKIYRGKFIAYAVFVVSIGLALGALTCAILLDQWVGNSRNEASGAFSRVENSLQYDSDRIEAFMQRVYSNSGLVSDIRSFLGNNAEGYLTSRLQGSQYNRPLVSFPDDMKSFLSNGGKGDITQISLHTEQEGNVVSFDNNGNTSYQFRLPNSDETFRETIQRGFVYHKKLSDPNQISRQIGEFRFLVSSDRIFKTVQNYHVDEAAAVSDSGDVYLIAGNGRGSEELIRRIMADGRTHGFLSTGFMDRTYFVTFHSNEFDYRFVSTVDLASLIRQKANVLLIVFLIVLAAMICVLLLIVYNLREDANFLRRIIASIGRVKTADFTPVNPARYRRNEYGMIARELDDMIRQLDRHIRTNYLLKLKQQETEMKALQHQINPHFLYNTLEVIRSSALVHSADHTSDAIATLGALYRDIVKNENIIPLGSELNLLQKYLKIMEFKYPDRFFYQFNVDTALLSLPTVKFWLQPLAENFFIHGFHPESEFNLLLVNGWEEAGRFVLEIVDNGNWISEEQLAEIRQKLSRGDDASVDSIGLRNVYTRLRFFYGKGFSMRIDNNEEAGVKITVILSKEATDDVQAADRR
ncbi:sensor histidine kinase [Paenibacillus glycanilyticus]|uniref:Two-component sensor histidine kinase n=1 Tax=Paenibacillus glycanilyticus TaxID=126569 RepID=A0ABQ6GK43_9BACL|nr:sensor histidine kinase [Paenibacillus glycanilyticus]GLX69738.1 two-component sensor histidine kinase [Paenibacillus glycanilyticus]